MIFPLIPGSYEISWENRESSNKLKSKVDITFNEGSSLESLNKTLNKKLSNFDKIKGDYNEAIVLLEPIIHPNRQVCIIDIENEYTINDLLNNGYKIREFHNYKCILELKRFI